MSETTHTKRILCVGMCVADIIHVCTEYPAEDSDKRCKAGRWQRGGNASNNCTVLAALGHPVAFLGQLGRSALTGVLLDDMDRRRIRYADCPRYDGETPLSSVLLNEATGSRTIVHSNPGVPTLLADEHFAAVDLNGYDWVHFEGRDPEQISRMMQRIREHNAANEANIAISLDMEKTRVEFAEELLRWVDVAFVGKELAVHWGCRNMRDGAEHVWRRRSDRERWTVVCAWGESGAAAINRNGMFECPAHRVDRVVDSLGAGDTFLAAVVSARCFWPADEDWSRALRFGCRIAGEKLRYYGYDCVAEVRDSWLEEEKLKD